MKTKISFLTLIFLLSSLMFFLSSCQKDEAVHLFDPNVVYDQSSKDSIKPVRTIDYFSEFENIEDLNSDLFLTGALESLNSGERSFGNVAIRAYACADGGETLIVYNPSNPDHNVYDTREFQVLWLRAGEQAGTRARLPCVCEGRYAVIVLNRISKIGVGKALYFSSASCNADETNTIGNDEF